MADPGLILSNPSVAKPTPFIHMSTPSLCLRSMTPKELYEGRNPNAMQRGEYGEWNRLLPKRSPMQCEPTVYPGEGIYVQVCHVPFCSSKKGLTYLLGLQDLLK